MKQRAGFETEPNRNKTSRQSSGSTEFAVNCYIRDLVENRYLFLRITVAGNHTSIGGRYAQPSTQLGPC